MSHGHLIRCHSPFKHYEMFHSSHLGGGFRNSIWGGSRTTYNITINDGGFWGGFKSALGGWCGNVFGGLLGGFLGGFGGFGFGGIGYGGGYGGGSYWNQGGSGSCKCNHNDKTNNDGKTSQNGKTNTSNNTSSAHECIDKDQSKINTFLDRLNALKGSKDPNEAVKLYNEISDKIKTPVDESHAADNKGTYERLLRQLRNDWNFVTDGDGKATQATGKSTPVASSVGLGAGSNPASSVAAASNDDDDDDENEPDDVTTKTGLEKALGNKSDNDKGIDFIKTIPDSVKSEYYKAGYTNYDGSEDISDKDVVDAQDDSGNTRPTNKAKGKGKATITKSSDGNHPQTIVIHDKKDVTYTYQGKAGSEYIYESDKDHQLYVLQKDSNGEFHLTQYKYMKGYGIADWS